MPNASTAKRNVWQEMIQTCVLGSARRAPDLTLSGTTGEVLADLEAALEASGCTKEEKILTALTTLSIARRSGQKALDASSLPAPPPAVALERSDTRAFCSHYSINLLNHILADQAKGSEARRLKLIRDWLTFCRDAERLVMPAQLPRLLELLKNMTDLHQLLADCGGHYLQWLLPQNADWFETYKDVSSFNSAEHESPERLIAEIELGADRDRQLAFQRLRKIDRRAQTKQAIDCLQTLWEKESVEQKMTFLKALSAELSMNDEPFLEEVVLADRRKEIRLAAAGLLIKLPQSRLIARMRERAEGMIGQSAKVLEIDLPAEFDKTMARDGIEETINVDSRIGQKAGWLYQIVSLVDPTYWQERHGLSPSAFLKHVLSSGAWSLPMVLGLLNACALYSNEQFQQAIIDEEAIHLTESQAGQAFLKALPTEQLEKLILARLPKWAQTDRKSAPRLDLWYYLELVDFHWSETFSQALLLFIIKEIREKVPVFGHTFYSNATNFGLRAHVEAGRLLEEINLAEAEIDTWTRNGLERFIDTLKLRFEMRQSFLGQEQ
ncbi:MAG: hypothetical protein KGS72_02485 [Cyanobacteria bacterium REEB67]|nr:hypothetical protein [Cyanobacteria bacterium REEB67]